MSASDMSKYKSIIVDIAGALATIKMLSLDEGVRKTPPVDVHWDLQAALNDLREDHSVRVIVITGAHDGEFLITPKTSHFGTDPSRARLTEPSGAWKTMLGTTRLHTTMAEIEKPIIAKVNGDAIGFGQSIMFSSDLIVAREDAVVNDIHLGQGAVHAGNDQAAVGPPFGLAPGDGAGATVPLFMSPVKAKEYLMLAKSYTGAELAAMNCINYAVPASELDTKVEDLVAQLLSKSAYALAWAKRISSRHVVHQLNMALDAGMAYQMLNLLQAERMGFRNIPSLG